MTKREKIIHLLTEEYSIILATTKKEFEMVYKIRKEVYAHKFSLTSDTLKREGFLSTNKEDEQSCIYLLKHNKTEIYVGTLRIMFFNKATPIQKLLMQEEGGVHEIETIVNHFPMNEVSRFALIHNLPDHEKFSKLELRTSLTIGLMVAIRLNLFLYPSERLFAFMERSLYIILKRQDAKFIEIGDPVDLHGLRTPYAIERKKLLRDTEQKGGEITRFYLKKMCDNPGKLWKFIDNNPYLDRSDIHLDKICKLFEEYGGNVDISQLLREEKD